VTTTGHGFLAEVHRHLAPQTYLEIGVGNGSSLQLARCRSIGVDPAFGIRRELACDVALFRQTSDDFFRRPDALAHFGGRPIDLAFIDGLHLFEYALRDFINVERHASPYGVIIFDDMLPGSVKEAARKRRTIQWTGDVFRIGSVLGRYRPDLEWRFVDTEPTGLLVVFGADPTNRVLAEHYDEIVREQVKSDPQPVAESILGRGCAVDPDRVLESSLWASLTSMRAAEATRSQVVGFVRGTLPPPGTAAAWAGAGIPRQTRRGAGAGLADALRPANALRRLWLATPRTLRERVIQFARDASA
jgi:hypothetical protein